MLESAIELPSAVLGGREDEKCREHFALRTRAGLEARERAPRQWHRAGCVAAGERHPGAGALECRLKVEREVSLASRGRFELRQELLGVAQALGFGEDAGRGRERPEQLNRRPGVARFGGGLPALDRER